MHRFLKPRSKAHDSALPSPTSSTSGGIDPPTPGMATPGVGSSSLGHSSSSFLGASATPLREAGEGDVHAAHAPASSSGCSEMSPSNSNAASLSASSSAAALQRQTAYEIMAETLFRYAQRERLFSDHPSVWNGVALRLAKGHYACVPAPEQDPRLATFVDALRVLNCDAAVTITSTVVAGITSGLSPDADEVALSPTDRVQVFESIEDVAAARKAQGAAFVRGEARLVVWSDKVEELMDVARSMETRMVRYVWERATGQALPSAAHAAIDADAAAAADAAEKDGAGPSPPPAAMLTGEGVRKGPGGEKLVTRRVRPADFDEKNPQSSSLDPEALVTHQERHTNLQAPLLHGLAVALNTVVISLMLRTLVTESAIDGDWTRLAIFCAAPGLFVITLFFSDNIIQGLALLFGPIRQMSLNSRYYSGAAPERLLSGTSSTPLPHVTIQMPVYKESLDTVLAPTIESLNRAIRTYELQGGTAAILVSEDGLLLVDDEERQKRLEYYDRHQIAWVARPGHNKDGYVRKGRFKKASNLNFTCALSLAVEEMMLAERGDAAEWTTQDENALYERALQRALAESHPLAQASGNIRIGDLILLIDCDTRVPEDCFLDAASEMTQCPDVAILQHCSGVMLVTESANNYFEKGIGFFTRCINFAISYTVANGDLAPFMGHNAYLRWSAIQEAAYVDAEDGVRKIWSESTVSEDFEMSLRVLMKGYITRWATYSNDEYKEGVSLTCDDELNRWQKYAFGVSELVFQPLHRWIYKGPVTRLWMDYLWAKPIPVHAKLASSSYIFSYYAIASALPLTVGLCLAQGWFGPVMDGAFLPPFNVFVAVVVVFSGLGNLANIIAKFRSRRYTFGTALREHVVWLPFLVVFFSGLSFHVLTAILAHPLSYNMTWGATNKDLEDSNFFLEVPAILKKYWRMLAVCIIVLAGVAVLSTDVLPIEWQIHGGFYVIWTPILLSSMHILYHIVLNPQLLRFSF